MKQVHRKPLRWLVAVATLSLIAAACGSSGQPETSTGATDATQMGSTERVRRTTTTTAASVLVPPDREAETFVVHVKLTDEGPQPPIIHIPAGPQIRLVLRSGAELEHHYRVVGLIPTDLLWRMVPVVDPYELDSGNVDLEELAGGNVDDMDHILHHLTPDYVPFREASGSGIRPFGTEVHGYTTRGETDVMLFHALNTGRFEVVDELWPELSGTVVVFDPAQYAEAAGS